MLYTSVLFADVYGNALCSCIETGGVYVCVVCTCVVWVVQVVVLTKREDYPVSTYSNNRLHLPC